MRTRRTAVRLAAALAVVPLALAGCSGSVDGDGAQVDVDVPDVKVPEVDAPDLDAPSIDAPDVEVTTK